MKKCRALIEKSDDGIENFFSNAVLSLGRFSNNHFNRTCITSSYQTGKLNVHRICTDLWFPDKNFNFQTSWKGECPDRIHAPQWGLCGDRQVTYWPNLAWSPVHVQIGCTCQGLWVPSHAVWQWGSRGCKRASEVRGIRPWKGPFWSQLLITMIRLE